MHSLTPIGPTAAGTTSTNAGAVRVTGAPPPPAAFTRCSSEEWYFGMTTCPSDDSGLGEGVGLRRVSLSPRTPRWPEERTQQLGRGHSLNPCAFEVAVVGPDRHVQAECQREHVDIAWVAIRDLLPCRHDACAISARGVWTQREQVQGVVEQGRLHSKLERKPRQVLRDLGQYGFGHGELANGSLEEQPPRLPAQQGGQDGVSVDDEPIWPP